MADSQTILEKQQHQLLKWNSRSETYYKRDWSDETRKYLYDKMGADIKAIDWKWYKYENPMNNVPSLRGHSLSDIGNDSMITIGDRRKRDKIDIYRINKYFDTFEKIETKGHIPCCRFSHSSDYIPSIHSILFFGGFDSQCNFNDARLLSLSEMKWYNLSYPTHIDFRAHHSHASRLINNTNKFEVYIFGGMYCAGGPYKYHNDIYKFTFYDGFFECQELMIKCDNKPIERAQCYSWIKDGTFYVFGGSIATSTLNDLWALDLNTNIWSEIEYKGILRAPTIYGIKPRHFKVGTIRKPCYFDTESNQLIVIHYGELTHIQKEFIEFDGTLKQFKEKDDDSITINDDKKRKRKKGAIGLLSDSMKCTIFVFDVYDKIWFIKRNKNLGHDEKDNIPSKLVGSTRILRIGDYLVQIGGGIRGANINYMKHLFMLKIPLNIWSTERLLWIGHYKINKNEEENGVSIFSKCAKEIISLILSFLNPKPY